MQPAPESPTSYGQRQPLRRRIAGVVLALAVEGLLVLLLLQLAPRMPGLPGGSAPMTTFSLNPDTQSEARRSRSVATRKASAAAQAPAVAPPAAVQPPPPPPVVKMPLNMVIVTREDFAASDIGKMQRNPALSGPPAPPGGGGTESDGADADSGGATGPGGEPLYNAEWYREPTDAELATYLPHNMPDRGWGMVGCRTVARYHVEDCFEIGESPGGSGLSRAVRQASFQFLVRPPRVGGRQMVGAWVKIKITYTPRKAGG